MNLLQGTLAATSPHELRWQSWRVAAVLAAVLLCLHLGARSFELNRLRQTEATLNASIEDAFRAAMPGQQNATNARRRVVLRQARAHGSREVVGHRIGSGHHVVQGSQDQQVARLLGGRRVRGRGEVSAGQGTHGQRPAVVIQGPPRPGTAGW